VLRKRQVPADAKSGNETIEKIRQLAGLRDEGLLTEEEFQAKKKELLAAL
jgi:hypothetical protein